MEVKKSIKKLRCYARQQADGSWYAHCIDLNIDAEAKTFPKVRESLTDAMIGYLETVMETEDQESIGRLINRSSPMRHHLTYHYAKLITKLSRKDDDGSKTYLTFDRSSSEFAQNCA